MTIDGNGRTHQSSGVRTGGQYAASSRTEADVSLGPAPLSDRDPVSIDVELASLHERRAQAVVWRGRCLDGIHSVVDARDRRSPWGSWMMTDREALDAARAKLATGDSFYERDYLSRQVDLLDGTDRIIGDLDSQIRPLDGEYERRGGWPRAFLVVGGDGHVHSSMGCSTCNRGERPTAFQWMTDYSGAAEQEIVAAAGWRACTVCYPSAPVGDERTLPTAMFSEEDKRKAADRTERAAKAERARLDRIAKGLTPDGSPLRVSWVHKNSGGWDSRPGGRPGEREYVYRDRPGHEDFKTERSAVSWYVQAKALPGAYDPEQYADAFTVIEQALAGKRGTTVEQVRADLDAKVRAKRSAL